MTRRPLLVAMAVALLALASPASPAEPPPLDAAAWLGAYEEAFNAKDLAALGRMYHVDATVFEGGSIDKGWAAYRDHHLAPELAAMGSPKLSHGAVASHVDATGQWAYVTSEYRLQAKVEDRDVDAGGLETLILGREPDGRWTIRHTHTSSRRRAPAPAPSPAVP